MMSDEDYSDDRDHSATSAVAAISASSTSSIVEDESLSYAENAPELIEVSHDEDQTAKRLEQQQPSAAAIDRDISEEIEISHDEDTTSTIEDLTASVDENTNSLELSSPSAAFPLQPSPYSHPDALHILDPHAAHPHLSRTEENSVIAKLLDALRRSNLEKRQNSSILAATAQTKNSSAASSINLPSATVSTLVNRLHTTRATRDVRKISPRKRTNIDRLQEEWNTRDEAASRSNSSGSIHPALSHPDPSPSPATPLTTLTSQLTITASLTFLTTHDFSRRHDHILPQAQLERSQPKAAEQERRKRYSVCRNGSEVHRTEEMEEVLNKLYEARLNSMHASQAEHQQKSIYDTIARTNPIQIRSEMYRIANG